MTPRQVTQARRLIGLDLGLKRELHKVELGKLLRLTGRDPGNTVRVWEQGRRDISGPAVVALEAMLDGWRPANWKQAISEETGK